MGVCCASQERAKQPGNNKQRNPLAHGQQERFNICPASFNCNKFQLITVTQYEGILLLFLGQNLEHHTSLSQL